MLQSTVRWFIACIFVNANFWGFFPLWQMLARWFSDVWFMLPSTQHILADNMFLVQSGVQGSSCNGTGHPPVHPWKEGWNEHHFDEMFERYEFVHFILDVHVRCEQWNYTRSLNIPDISSASPTSICAHRDMWHRRCMILELVNKPFSCSIIF